MSVIEHARMFAKHAHRNHFRKYTNEPYFVHLDEVAQILVKRGVFNDDVIAAAYLHDVIEDGEITKVTYRNVVNVFGEDIADLVMEVTDATSWLHDPKPSRPLRKRIDRQYLAGASAKGQSIKLADLISNTKDIVTHDPGFAKIYIPEKKAMLMVLDKGDHILRHDARNSIEWARTRLLEAGHAV